jgi:exodeoxyribonuclease VIII
MQNVMLDLETMGTDPNAAIIAVGAVEFDIEAGHLGETFYSVVDLSSSVSCGGQIDPSTVIWWLKQSDEARAAICRKGKDIEVVLHEFSQWISKRAPRDDVLVWGNGADFDNVILGCAYHRNGILIPWKYSNNRCYRTAKVTHRGVPMEFYGTPHNALDDARNQAYHLLAILKKDANLRRLLSRYFEETPIGHQPHMIYHEAAEALRDDQASAEVEPTAPWPRI